MKMLILATRNSGKIREIKALLADLSFEILSLEDLPDLPSLEEDQDTFVGNAKKKAETIARRYGKAALADDSGLEVDFLDGQPGVYSAIFAGSGAPDAANNSLLLEKLQGVPPENRGAAFRCVLALAIPGGETHIVEGCCRGRIADSPRGAGGFGYDPLFIYEPSGLTFAQMGIEEKNKVSHRAGALKKLCALLEELLIAEG